MRKCHCHPVWHRLIESSNLFKLVRTGFLLECTVLNVFDAISLKFLLRLGTGFVNEDTLTWLYLPRNQDFEFVFRMLNAFVFDGWN